MTVTPYIPRLYGRRQDKPLKPRQARLMETLLPRVSAPDPASLRYAGQADASPAKPKAKTGPAAEPIDPAALFPQAEEIWLEVGFGGGEHLAWQAARNPNVGLIGAEAFVNGVAKLLVKIDEDKLGNVRIHFGDARPLMEALPEASLARLFVLHPDPWPKKRHRKRRMISPWFFSEAARLLAPGGDLRVASDSDEYIAWTLTHARGAPDFEWTAERADDWRRRPEDWPQTRYEAKSLKDGRRPAYLIFRRR